MRPVQPPDRVADIALLLEGTYPFVSGGVSSWVHQLLRGVPDRTFSLVFIGGRREAYGDLRFELPANVIHLECHYLDEPPPTPRHAARTEAFERVEALHAACRDRGRPLPTALLQGVAQSLGKPGGTSYDSFLHDERSWARITQAYADRTRNTPFLDYFWTVRTMHGPVYKLAAIADGIPPAKAFHAISTGYAGFLGMLLRHRRNRPFMITEHGIYTKERRIDLNQAAWLRDSGPDEDGRYLRELWIRFFEGLGRAAYASADPIVALYEGNRERQITDGAAASKTRVIPNGINVRRFLHLRARPPAKPPLVLGLLGRVVPIKDTRTFIQAMRLICTARPEAEGWIIGPADEDPDYARECVDLVRSLGLDGHVKFLGFQKPEEILPKLGLLVLTSISEALPLVILEGFACGLPVVSTDVGACRELVEGAAGDDRALGPAGCVTSIADPEGTAAAALSLLDAPPRWHAAREAGLARVEKFYGEDRMLGAYRQLYDEAVRWRA